MKKKIIFIIMLIALILPYTTKKIYEITNGNINYKESVEILEQLPGTYTSEDGKTLTINTDGTVLFENTWPLTVTKSARGNILKGNIGTTNKSLTLYQVNETTLVSSQTVTYGTTNGNKTIYEYTTFRISKSIIPSSAGKFTLYRNNTPINTYATLQDAIDAANDKDTIKINGVFAIAQGSYIDKNITIEGNNNKLDKSKWANPLFVIKEGIKVNINNLTVDGGEKTFEIDYSTETPSIKNNTLDETVKANAPLLISKGNLVTNNFNVQNYNTVQKGAAIRVVRGTAKIKNGKFNHNYGNEEAVVINAGSALKESESTFPVEEIIIENCEFKDNFVPGGSGGAILLTNTKTIKVNNSKFYNNIVTTASSGGGAIYYDASGQRTADSLNIEYPEFYINDSYFEGNYSGNDGFAVSNDSAHLYVNNSTFTKNVGLHASSSVGTVSCMVDGPREFDLVIKNSLFKENKGPVTGIGDHGTLAKINIDNVVFDGNTGNLTLLIYQGTGIVQNTTFKNENNQVGILDVRTAYNSASQPLYQPNTVTLKNLIFENNNTPADIFIRKQNHNTSLNTATVNIEGTIKGDIDIIDGQKLNINGKIIGTIHSEDTLAQNTITEESQDNSTYKLNRYHNHYIATVYYPLDENNTPSVEYLYLEKGKTYTEKEIFMLLKNDVEGYTTKLYTNNTYTTSWTYTGTSNVNLYGKLEEHTHEFDGTLIVDDNIIYQQCILGHFGKQVSLQEPATKKYTGKEIPIVLNNELNIKDYKLIYYVLENNEWKELDTVPKNIGRYKAQLIYDNLSIEKEYVIEEEITNPNTSINIWLIFFLTAILVITLTYIKVLENIKVKKYNN